MIYFDIDGTLRDLHATFPDGMRDFYKWEDFTSEHYEFVKQNLRRCLYDAPIFQDVYELIKSMTSSPVFLTSNTASDMWNHKFIQKYFSEFKIIVVASMEEKLKYLKDDVLLFDDYPYFPEVYRDKVVLVEREWNKEFSENYNKVFRGKR